MTTHHQLLTVKFDGSAVGPGKIPVDHLLRFLSNLNKALHRTGRVLQGESQSLRRGTPPRSIKDEVALDLVLLTHGSPSAVLGFERRQPAPGLPGMDFGLEILEKSIGGLAAIQQADAPLPAGYDSGVLMAWRDAGVLLSTGVSHIEFRLKPVGAMPIVASLTPDGIAQIQAKIKGPQTNIRSIEGRLLMADFKEHGTRCRVHPSSGEPVLCLFDEEQKEEVLEDILRYVRVVGEAKEDALTGKITSIKIHDIERLEDQENKATELLPQGTPISRGFWQSPSLDELALAQNVRPMADVKALFRTWPGEPDDGFEAAIDDLRHQGLAHE